MESTIWPGGQLEDACNLLTTLHIPAESPFLHYPTFQSGKDTPRHMTQKRLFLFSPLEDSGRASHGSAHISHRDPGPVFWASRQTERAYQLASRPALLKYRKAYTKHAIPLAVHHRAYSLKHNERKEGKSGSFRDMVCKRYRFDFWERSTCIVHRRS